MAGYGLLVVRSSCSGRTGRTAVPWSLDDLIAHRIAEATPGDAVVARLDDEDHCVGLSVRDDIDAMVQAELVVAAFAVPFVTNHGTWTLEANVGVAVRQPGTVRTTTGLLREARSALLQSARLGPGFALLFDPVIGHAPGAIPCTRRRPRPY